MKTPATLTPRQRRFLLVLPLLVVPFLAMAFWALGGGGDVSLPASLPAGLNIQLPAPRLEAARQQDKLSLYEQLGKRLRAQSPDKQSLLHDTGIRELLAPWSADTSTSNLPQAGILPSSTETAVASRPELREAEITERLTRLTALVSRGTPPSRAVTQAEYPAPNAPAAKGSIRHQDIDRLERLMQDMSSQPAPADPEVQQLEGMLDRILDIQHPERVRARLQRQSRENSRQLFPLQPLPSGPAVTLLGAAQDTDSPASGLLPAPPRQRLSGQATSAGTFHGLDNSHVLAPPPANYLAAVIREKQKVTTGSIVHIRLLQDAYLDGHLLPAGTQLHGTCRLQGERLFITISSARAGDALLPVSLSAHDLDGLEGLYVPGTLNQQAARQGTQQVLGQGMPLPPLAPSLGAQAASAGIEAARNLFSRKARVMRVTLPAGHRLLLLDPQAAH